MVTRLSRRLESPWPYYKNKVWCTYIQNVWTRYELNRNSKASPVSYWLSLLPSLKGSLYMAHWNNYLTITLKLADPVPSAVSLWSTAWKTPSHSSQTVSGFTYMYFLPDITCLSTGWETWALELSLKDLSSKVCDPFGKDKQFKRYLSS